MNQWYTTRPDDAPGREREGSGMQANDESTGTYDPNADLFGDWSWKPDRYPSDPGKVYTADQIRALYPDGLTYGAPSIHHAAIFGADYAGITPRPARIGPHVG